MCFLVSIKKRFCTLRLLFFIFKHFVRFLFEGGFYFLFLNILCGFYSRAASIQGRLLFKKIRYVPWSRNGAKQVIPQCRIHGIWGIIPYHQFFLVLVSTTYFSVFVSKNNFVQKIGQQEFITKKERKKVFNFNDNRQNRLFMGPVKLFWSTTSIPFAFEYRLVKNVS